MYKEIIDSMACISAVMELSDALRRVAHPSALDADFNPSKHPRGGDPKNRGRFSKGGVGTAASHDPVGASGSGRVPSAEQFKGAADYVRDLPMGSALASLIDDMAKGECEDADSLEMAVSFLDENDEVYKYALEFIRGERERDRAASSVESMPEHQKWRPQAGAADVNEMRSSATARGFGVSAAPLKMEHSDTGSGHNCFLADVALFLRWSCGIKANPPDLEARYSEENLKIMRAVKGAMESAGWKPVNSVRDSGVIQRNLDALPDGAWVSFWNGESSHNTSNVKVNGKWYMFDSWGGCVPWRETSSSKMASILSNGGRSGSHPGWDSYSYAYIPGVSRISPEFFRYLNPER